MPEIALLIGGILILIVIGVLVAAARQPRAFRIERSIESSATPTEIFSILSDFRRFTEWSPWQDKDPQMKTEIMGEPGQIGSSYAWNGNNQVGEGRMTITGIELDKCVKLKLDFIKPFAATNTVEWRIDHADGQRRIGWVMDGRNDKLLPRVMSLFMDMDKMVGSDFEKGLASLKALAESPSKGGES